MKNLFLLHDSAENKISYYYLAAFLILLPFDRFYSQLALAGFILHTLVHLNRGKLKNAFTVENLILSSIWFISLGGLLYTPYKDKAVDDILRQSAILLFPFFISASGFPVSRYKKKLLQLFALTCIIIILYLYAHAFYTIFYYKLSLSSLFNLVFINHNFSLPIGIHATYLSLYAGLSLVFLAFCFFNEPPGRSRILYSSGMIVLLAGLLQLASRSVLIATIFIFFAVFPLFLPKRVIRSRFIIVVFLIALLALTGVFSIDSFKRRFVTGLKNDLTETSLNNEQLEPRIIRWKFVMELIREKPFAGYGSGSEKELLKKIYYEKKFYNSYLHELNAHNQYLSVWLKTGAWGLLILLATFVYGLVHSWKKRDVVFAAFLIFVCIVSFSENIFDVNKGIFFYAFFFAFFMYSPAKKNQPV
jgi:O-antigen ligase